MLLLILLSLFAGALGASAPLDQRLYELEDAENHFEKFVQEYNRQYADEQEREMRFKLFKQNLEKINLLNIKNPLAEFGITMFSDFSAEELIGLNGATRNGNCTRRNDDPNDDEQFDQRLEETWDWREKNAVTRVKDQKACGSCWSFSTSGNIEGQYAIKNGQLLEFSEQQMVDCNKRGGCERGSYVSDAILDVIQQGGLETEANYPYLAKDGKCHSDPSKFKVKLQGCLDFTHTDEDVLMQVLRKFGPLSIVIDALDAIHYKKGIMATCEDDTPNHAVLLVGYGTENNTPYWIIKNSWSEKYGEKGYFRVKRGHNLCGLQKFEVVVSVL